jgi:putative FmdB family regulatory protein
MPIYGYRCGQCGHELEVLQSMSDPPLRACPECGGALSKMLYPVGVHFKGSGFYSTDYGKNGGAPAKKDGKSESAGETAAAGPAAESPAEKKPDKKPESAAGKE